MADGFIQLPADSTGKKIRTHDRGAAGHDQYILHADLPTWYIQTPNLAPAANKLFLCLHSTAVTGPVLRIEKLFIQQASAVAIAGVGLQFDVKRISAIVGGTAVTPNPADTADGALANITCVHTATSATEGVVMMSVVTSSEEMFGPNAGAAVYSVTNLLPEFNGIRSLTIRPGEGICVKQITSNALGFMSVLAVVTKEL